MVTYTVTTTSDAGDNLTVTGDLASETADGGGLSLREAVILSNAAAGADRIEFDASLNGQTIFFYVGGELQVTDTLTIDGDSDNDGAADITVTAGYFSRLINVTSSSTPLNLEGITLRAGATTNAGEHGGAVRSNSAIYVTDSTISNSSTNGDGAKGGALYAPSITLTRSTLDGNSTRGDSASGGGAYAATITVVDSTIKNNFTTGSTTSLGGGLAGNTVDVTNSTISGNRTYSDGSSGGGIWAETLTLNNATVSGNFTAGANAAGGGAIGNTAAYLSNSIVLGNIAYAATVDEIGAGAPLSLYGTNIIGRDGVDVADVFLNGSDVGDTTAAQVFATTVDNNGVTAGRLTDNGGPVETIALQSDLTNPAIDASDANGEAYDARGQTAFDQVGVGNDTGNGIRDVGAYEIPGVPEASSLVVTTAADVVSAVDGETSLREAIAYANSKVGADTITFDPSLSGQTISMTGLEMTITEALTINGDIDSDGTADITVSGSFISRIFNISEAAATTTINGLILERGDSTGPGGAIYSAANLYVTDSVVRDNDTTGTYSGGGGIYGAQDVSILSSTISGNNTFGSDAFGGGVQAAGALTITDSTISGNYTFGLNARGGGAAATTVTVINSTVSGNSTKGGTFPYDVGTAFGGGIYAGTGGAAVANSTISGNYTLGSNASGGGISANGDVVLANSIVVGNISTGASAGNDEIGLSGNLYSQGGNIIGRDALPGARIFNSGTYVGYTTAADVFAVTTNNNGTTAGVLADNGGPVETIALNLDPTNPARDASNANGTLTDARGVAAYDLPGYGAESGPNVRDLGAYEAGGPPSLYVTTALDVVDPTDGVTSLREAIAASNAGYGYTISFDPSLAGSTITLASGQLVITAATKIDGDIDDDGTADITIDADGQSRAINAVGSSAVLNVTGLVITGGYTDAFGASGAAIRTDADLKIYDSVITNNHTTGDSARGGAIFSSSYGAGGFTTGDLYLRNTTVSNNSTSGYDADGGGIFSVGFTSLLLSDVTGNSTTGDRSSGGGIYASRTLSLSSSAVNGNSTEGLLSAGGGVQSSRISGGTAVFESEVNSNSTLGANSGGGGIYSSNLTINRTTVDGNSTQADGGAGGGILASTLQSTNSTVSNNSVYKSFGGGIAVTSGTLLNTTVSGNSATGALSSGGGIVSSGTLTIQNSTITGNSVGPTGFYGGGIRSTGTLYLSNSIVLGNSAPSSAEIVTSGTFVRTGGNIIGTDVFDGTVIQGTTTAADVFFETQNNNGVDAGVLADNGGPVQTVALNPTPLNPAIDASDANAPTSDARLIPIRDWIGVGAESGNERRDLGAYETGPERGSLVVTTNLDVVNGYDGVTSLREALSFANQNAGPDTVTFDPTLSGTTITLNGTQLYAGAFTTINGDIDGDDTPDITLDANGQSRVLFTSMGTGNEVTLNGLIITGGYLLYGSGAGIFGGELTVTNSVVTGNSTQGNNSGGGGISARVLTLTDSTVSYNSTAGDNSRGGGINASYYVTITGSYIIGNSTSGNQANGGGLATVDGSFDGGFTRELSTITDTVISGNQTTGDNARGGGVSASNILVSNSEISGNSTAGNFSSAGGISASYYGGFTNVTVTGNSTTGQGSRGGGIEGQTVKVTNSTISSNGANGANSDGGGISGSYVTITGSVISNNGAARNGGGINGGNLLQVTGSTISGNTANADFARGGGLSATNIELTNATISNNSTYGRGSEGGGIWSGGSITLENSTVTGNSSTAAAGDNREGAGVVGASSADITLINSIVFGNANDLGQFDVELFGGRPFILTGGNIVGRKFQSGANVYDGSTIVNGAFATNVFAQTQDNNGVLAGVLADNGGPVETVALNAAANNPAIDASDTNAQAFDARGQGPDNFVGIGAETGIETRDLGAFESVNEDPTLTGLPTDLAFDEDTPGDVDLSGITLTDIDSAAVTVTLQVTSGQFSSVADGTGLGVQAQLFGVTILRLTGAPDDIETYLQTTSNIKYTGPTNGNGDALSQLSVVVNDNDGSGNIDIGTIDLNVAALNDAPTSTGAPTDLNFTEDTEGNVDLSSVTLGDVDSASITVTLTIDNGSFSTPASGAGVGSGVTATRVDAKTITLVGAPDDITTYLDTVANIKYTGDANDNGDNAALLTLTLNDGDGSGDVSGGTVNLDIAAVDDPSVAVDDAFTVDETGVVTLGNLFGPNPTTPDFDLDLDPFSVTQVNGEAGNVAQEIILPSGAKLTVNADGTFTYDPNAAFEGLLLGAIDTDTFLYTITGGDTATVTLTILGQDTNEFFDGVTDTGIFDGGPLGQDTVSYVDALAGVLADLTTPANNTGAAAGDLFVDIEALLGSAFDDTLLGSGSADALSGNDGQDSLVGNDGADTLNGGAGNDTIKDGDGDDLVDAGAGDDLIVSGSGNDTFNGGDDIDTFQVNLDDFNFTPGFVVETNLSTNFNGPLGGGPLSDEINNFENVTFLGAGADVMLTGDDNANVLITAAGNDTLAGGGEDDTLRGNEGADELKGEDGLDLLEGGSGDDTLRGGLGDDTLLGGGNNDDLAASDGEDVLSGDGGNDTLSGQDGDDTLSGGSGKDALSGGLGKDELSGGGGNDSLVGGNGKDTLNGEGGKDNLSGGGGSDNLSGGSSNDGLSGGGGSDTLAGETGKDTLEGNGGADLMQGGDADDLLNGGAGKDTLIGGEGRDILTGAGGADIFVFTSETDSPAGGSTRDQITDFTSKDLIDLSEIDAKTGNGNQAFSFIGSSAFSGKKGELRFDANTKKDRTIIEADRDGDGNADFQIELTGAITLNADDFLL